MSNASQLQKEIEYWSGLIQQHKEAKRRQEEKNDKVKSKYSWKKHDNAVSSTSILTSSSYTYTRSGVQNDRKRHFHEAAHSSHPPEKTISMAPTPAMMASTTGVAFQSKFKWTKPPNEGVSLTVSSQSNNIPASKPPPIKPVPPLIRPSIAIGPSTTSLKRTHSPSKVASAKIVSENTTQVQKNASITKSNYQYVAPGSGKQTVVTIKSTAQQHPGKWNSNNSYKWTSVAGSQESSRTKMGNISTKWPKQTHKKKSNPYKLNRVSKYQAHKRKLMPSHFKKHQHHNRSSNPRVLDRRHHHKKNPASLDKSVVEGMHLREHKLTVNQILANRVIKRLQTVRCKKQEKEGQHCLYFGRFGKCMRGDDCKFIHDPSRIAVCTRFLRGTCRDENCSFSHKVEKEKTPVCLHFLRGKCTLSNCPYLHVFLGKDAPICRTFATTGFCPDAEKCKMQHIKCCPEFYETGVCKKEKDCKLPHLGKKTISTKMTPKWSRKKTKESESANLPSAKENNKSSMPDFLSLTVDSPLPLNKPYKGTVMQIKPRLAKIKPKEGNE